MSDPNTEIPPPLFPSVPRVAEPGARAGTRHPPAGEAQGRQGHLLLVTAPRGGCFAGWKEAPTEGVIKREKGCFLPASLFSLTALFLQKRPDRF